MPCAGCRRLPAVDGKHRNVTVTLPLKEAQTLFEMAKSQLEALLDFDAAEVTSAHRASVATFKQALDRQTGSDT